MMAQMMMMVGVVFFAILPAGAQGGLGQREPADVPYDEVNRIAARMYCPVCEFEPLDTCQATTCVEWRAIIRRQLAEGRSEDEIISYFVVNYGDRVVGIPQDPFLRLLSLAAPLLMVMFVAVFGLGTFLRWRGGKQQQLVEVYHQQINPDDTDDDYRSRLESDLP